MKLLMGISPVNLYAPLTMSLNVSSLVDQVSGFNSELFFSIVYHAYILSKLSTGIEQGDYRPRVLIAGWKKTTGQSPAHCTTENV